MSKFFILFFAIFLFVCKINGQQQCNKYILNGTINADSGKIILLPIGDNVYYPYKNDPETNVNKGRFFFSNSISYPIAFKLGLKKNAQWKYISDVFFIDPGVQTIFCNIDSLREIPAIDNNSMKEYLSNYKNSFEVLNNKLSLLKSKKDSLDKVYKKKIPEQYSLELTDEQSRIEKVKKITIYSYVKQHPDSYVAMWKLIMYLDNGYEPIYDSIYHLFSKSIRHTYTGTQLGKKLHSARNLSIGSSFPKIELVTEDNKKITVPMINKNNRYTLVDFWFSHCGPCKRQFPKYKELYALYKNIGFELVGISVDSKKDIPDWEKVIKEKELNWPQYLDMDGTNAVRLSLHFFPSNFLLDENGRIIKKNISPDELEQFLTSRMGESKRL